MAVLKALVVEDDPGAQRLLELLLTRIGFEVRVVDDGLAALQQVSAITPDLVCVDLGLPHISGYDVVEGIRATAAGKRIPILVTTGHRLPQKLVLALQLGADAYLVKPFTKREFLSAVRALVPDAPRETLHEAR